MNRVLPARKLLVVAIAVVVGLLHFVTGPTYRGPLPVVVNGYMIDVLLPFAMVLVLGVANIAFLRSPFARAAVKFGVGATTETLQALGVPIFGRTFDPLDYLMFAIGATLAVGFERFVLSRIPQERA